jgi:ABC-type phosphate transport system ATPase subunit
LNLPTLLNTIKMSSIKLKSKHRKTLQAIFESPVRANILWSDIEKLLEACGAEVSEGRGSRVRIALNDVRAVFHRPHPRKETDRGAVVSMRRFLTEAGVIPDDGI